MCQHLKRWFGSIRSMRSLWGVFDASVGWAPECSASAGGGKGPLQSHHPCGSMALTMRHPLPSPRPHGRCDCWQRNRIAARRWSCGRDRRRPAGPSRCIVRAWASCRPVRRAAAASASSLAIARSVIDGVVALGMADERAALRCASLPECERKEKDGRYRGLLVASPCPCWPSQSHSQPQWRQTAGVNNTAH